MELLLAVVVVVLAALLGAAKDKIQNLQESLASARADLQDETHLRWIAIQDRELAEEELEEERGHATVHERMVDHLANRVRELADEARKSRLETQTMRARAKRLWGRNAEEVFAPEEV